jgi:hypothetical protein
MLFYLIFTRNLYFASRNALEIGITYIFFDPVAVLKLDFILPMISSSENKEESLLEKRRQLTHDISRLKETYEALLARFPNLRFAYK